MRVVGAIFMVCLGFFAGATPGQDCCGKGAACCDAKVYGIPPTADVIYDASCPSGGLGCDAGGVGCCRFCYPNATPLTYKCSATPTPKPTRHPTPKPSPCKPAFTASFDIVTGNPNDPIGCTNEAFRASLRYPLSALYGVDPNSGIADVLYSVKCKGLVSAATGAKAFDQKAVENILNYPVKNVIVTAVCA